MSAKQSPVVQIEYCKSCKTHNWFTHHNQAKYNEIFCKVSKAILKQFPEVIIKGNQLPGNLVPVKISENKYLDTSKNKYVCFPEIGAFQICCDGELLFSKRITNTWPVISELLDSLSIKITGNARVRSPMKEIGTEQETVTMENEEKNREDFHRATLKQNIQISTNNFTFTDHFKLYRKGKGQKIHVKDYSSEADSIDSKKHKNVSLEHKNGHRQNIGKRDSRTLFNENSGGRELIMKLDRIEEENISDQFRKIAKRPELATMEQWNQDLVTLEKKLQKFQQKVHIIKRESKNFQLPGNLDEAPYLINLAKSRGKENRSSKHLDTQLVVNEKLADKITEVNQTYKTRFVSKDKQRRHGSIDQFLNASEEEKSELLNRIYGLSNAEKSALPTAIKRNFTKTRRNKYRRSHDSHYFDANKYLLSDDGDSEVERSHSSDSAQMPKGINITSKNQFIRVDQKPNNPHFKRNSKLVYRNQLRENEWDSSDLDFSQKDNGYRNYQHSNPFLEAKGKSDKNKLPGLIYGNQGEKQGHRKLLSLKKNEKKLKKRSHIIQQNTSSYHTDKSHSSSTGKSPKKLHLNPNNRSFKKAKSSHLQTQQSKKIFYRGIKEKDSESSHELSSQEGTVLKGKKHSKGENTTFGRNNSAILNKSNSIFNKTSQKVGPVQEKSKKVSRDLSKISKNKPTIEKNRQARRSDFDKQESKPEGRQRVSNFLNKSMNNPIKSNVQSQHVKAIKTKEDFGRNFQAAIGFKKKNKINDSFEKDTPRSSAKGDSKKNSPKRNLKIQEAKSSQKADERKNKSVFVDKAKSNRKRQEKNIRNNRQQSASQKKKKAQNKLNDIDEEHSSIQKSATDSESQESLENSSQNEIQQENHRPNRSHRSTLIRPTHHSKEWRQSRTGQRERSQSPSQIQRGNRQISQNQRVNIKKNSPSKVDVKIKKRRKDLQLNMKAKNNSFKTQKKDQREQNSSVRDNSRSQISDNKSCLSSNLEELRRNYNQTVSEENLDKRESIAKQSVSKNKDKKSKGNIQLKFFKTESAFVQKQAKQNRQSKHSKGKGKVSNHSQKEKQQTIVNNSRQRKESTINNHSKKQEATKITNKQDKKNECSIKNESSPSKQKESCHSKREQKHSKKDPPKSSFNRQHSQQNPKSQRKNISKSEEQNSKNDEEISDTERDEEQTMKSVVKQSKKQQKSDVAKKSKKQPTKQKKDSIIVSKKVQKISKKQQFHKETPKKQKKKEKMPNKSVSKLNSKSLSQFPQRQQGLESQLSNHNQHITKQQFDDTKSVSSKNISQKGDSQENDSKNLIEKRDSESIQQKTDIQSERNDSKQNNPQKQKKQENKKIEKQESSTIVKKTEEYPSNQISSEGMEQGKSNSIIEQHKPKTKKMANKNQFPEEGNLNGNSELERKIVKKKVSEELKPQSQKKMKKVALKQKQTLLQKVKTQKSFQQEAQSQQEEQSQQISETEEQYNQSKEQIKGKQKKKTRKEVEKKTLKEYSKTPHQNPMNNVGSEEIQKRKNRQSSVLVSIGTQKHDYVEKYIQTQDEDHDNYNNLTGSLKNSFHKDQVPVSETKKQNLQRKKVNKTQAIFKKQSEQQSFQQVFGSDQQPEFQRAMILKHLYGQEISSENQKYEKVYNEQINIEIDVPQQQIKNASNTFQAIDKLKNFQNLPLFHKKTINSEKIIGNKLSSTNFRKVVKMLSQRNEYLIIRLFENINFRGAGFFGVWICDHYNWKCVILNHIIPVDQEGNPLYSFHRGQLWPMILEKALAIVFGGYDQLIDASIGKLFHMLTGSNFVSFKIREEYEKNQRFLKFLSENEKKNFIIHAEKHSSLQERGSERQASVFYVLSQTTINDGEILLKMREEDNQPFMIKLSKFADQFAAVEVLQLRVSHNFTSLKMPETKGQSNLAVCQLKCENSVFGCITLSHRKNANFRAYLYREEQQNILRLIGQAKEKKKNQLFFDCCFHSGNYFVFAECNRSGSTISYFGEEKPELKFKEKIQQSGLKNDYTEYIPLDTVPEEKQQGKMPKFISMNGTLKSSRDFGKTMKSTMGGRDTKAIEDLRQHFVEFLLGART